MKFLIFLLLVSSTCLSATYTHMDVPMDEFIRIRCSQKNENIYYEWQGNVYSMIPGEKQKHLFNVVGMNVARCLKNEDGSWNVITREIQMYRDPKTKKAIHKWKNPWSKRNVRVVHVANNPVQNRYPNVVLKAVLTNGTLMFNEDWPLTYPNALAGDKKYSKFGNKKLYQAVEIFKYNVQLKDFKEKSSSIEKVTGGWTRVGPWLPWMEMGNRAGFLVYSAEVSKVPSFDAISKDLTYEIKKRLPLYKVAPKCWLAGKNETSWTYFKKHLKEYKSDERFPVVAKMLPDNCKEK